MVFKKYIRRGGKLYGPYLYENKRVNGKVVTNYVGRSGDISPKLKYSLFLSLTFLFLATVFFLTVSFGFEDNTRESLSALAILESGPAPAEETVSIETGRLGVDFQGSVSYANPDVLVEFKTPDSASEEDPLPKLESSRAFATEPKQGISVSDLSVPWKMSIEAPAGNNAEIKIEIGSATHARVERLTDSVESSKVVVSARKSPPDELFDLFSGRISPEREKGVTLSIPLEENPVDYSISFSTSPTRAIKETLITGKESITVENLGDVDYKGIAVLLEVPELVQEDKEKLEIFSAKGESINYRGLDTDKGVILSFNADVPARSKESFEIALVEGNRISDLKTGDVLISGLPEVDLADLPESCMQECSPGACLIDSSSIFKDDVPSQISTTVCKSDNPSCPFPVFSVKEQCGLEKSEINVLFSEEITEPVFFGPADDESEISEQKEIYDVFDEETGERVALIQVQKGDIKSLADIIFTQERDAQILFSPSYCYNGLQDQNEEGIDCGGECDACSSWIPRAFPFVWWILLVGLLGLFIFSQRNHSLSALMNLRMGSRALMQKDFRKALIYYQRLRKTFDKLSEKEKQLYRGRCLDYYKELKENLAKRKIKVSSSGRSKGLSSLKVVSGNSMFNKTGASDVSRIEGLISKGSGQLRKGRILEALADYELMQRLYSGLDSKSARKLRRNCLRYYKDLSNELVRKKVSFEVKGDFPMPDLHLKN